MRQSKRPLALLLALLLTLGLVPALAEEKPPLERYAEFATPHSVKITYFEQGWTGPEADLDVVAPELAKRTNLTLLYEPMSTPTGDDYTQKLNLMVAANEVPEVFFGGNDAYTRVIYEKLGEAGLLWDIGTIVKDYPQLYELVYPELQLFQNEKGQNYFLPTQTGRGYENLHEPPHGLFLRQDLLDQLGMETPKTPDEFYTYLKRAREELKVNDQKVTGLLLGENLGGIQEIYEMFIPLVGQHETYGFPFDSQEGYAVKNYQYTNSPEIMQAAKFVHKLVSEGLVDREALIIKQAQYQEKATLGLSAAMTSNWWDANAFTDASVVDIPDLEWFTPTKIYVDEATRASRNRPWTDWVGCWSSLIFSKTVPEETLRHLLAVLDYMAGEEGQLLVQAGIEGVTYQWNELGTYEFLPEFIEKTNNLDWNKAAAYGVFYYAQLVNNTPVIFPLQATPPALTRPDNFKSWENQQDRRDAYDKHMEPPLDYYFLPGPVENEKLPAIKDATVEFWAKVVGAQSEQEVENIVNEWGATTKSLGIDDIVAEREAFMAKLKEERGIK